MGTALRWLTLRPAPLSPPFCSTTPLAQASFRRNQSLQSPMSIPGSKESISFAMFTTPVRTETLFALALGLLCPGHLCPSLYPLPSSSGTPIPAQLTTTMLRTSAEIK